MEYGFMSSPHSPAKLGPSPATKSADLQSVVSNIVTCQQSLQQQGMKLGSVSKKGNSFWGVLRLLNEQGPLTVPQIAQHRKVSRQAIQVMIDEYVTQGHLAFKDNPHHRRSKLVTLTAAGLREFSQLSSVIFEQLEESAQNFTKEELLITAKVLKKLQNSLDDKAN